MAHAQSIFAYVPTPNGHHGTLNNALQAVAASSPSDIWAVGQTTIHFDGTQWTAYAAPMINGDNTSYLDGVVDISPTDAWAAGIVGIGTAAPEPSDRTLEWHGLECNRGPDVQLRRSTRDIRHGGCLRYRYLGSGIAAGGRRELWRLSSSIGMVLTWTAYTGPLYGFFRGVSADASNDVWAVGYSGNETFSEHFDGTNWTLVRDAQRGERRE